MLKKIRTIEFINKIFRVLFIKFRTKADSLSLYLIRRWQTHGTMKCEFNNQKFTLFNNGDDSLLNYFYYKLPYHENNDLKLFMQLSKFSNCTIDIGANTGTFSILASKSNENNNIYSFEPFSTNYKRMQKNIALNDCKNIHTQFSALGNENGTIEMTVPQDDSVSDTSSINGDFTKTHNPYRKWRTENVKIQTLDGFCKENNLTPNLIKCDVETYEIPVFKGMFELLKTSKPTIMFECFLDDERKTFFDSILKEFDYHLYLILNEGLVYCDNGFQKNQTGFNYLISPVNPKENFIFYKDIHSMSLF